VVLKQSSITFTGHYTLKCYHCTNFIVNTLVLFRNHVNSAKNGTKINIFYGVFICIWNCHDQESRCVNWIHGIYKLKHWYSKHDSWPVNLYCLAKAWHFATMTSLLKMILRYITNCLKHFNCHIMYLICWNLA
jgi:hypothetical protein